MLARHESEPSGEVPTTPEVRHGGSEGLDRHGGYRSNAGHAAQAGGDGALLRLIGHPLLQRLDPFRQVRDLVKIEPGQIRLRMI